MKIKISFFNREKELWKLVVILPKREPIVSFNDSIKLFSCFSNLYLFLNYGCIFSKILGAASIGLFNKKVWMKIKRPFQAILILVKFNQEEYLFLKIFIPQTEERKHCDCCGWFLKCFLNQRNCVKYLLIEFVVKRQIRKMNVSSYFDFWKTNLKTSPAEKC